MISQNPIYRNKRKNYYQETGPDLVSVGTIINVLKTKSNKKSFDSQFIPTNLPQNGITAYDVVVGDPFPENNPDYQYYGYLYCDGSEYNIRDYPLLYSIIGNDYGGTVSDGINKFNVFDYWPDENMGTFKVPDLKAKKIVGYGPVYGTGSPTIGNIEMKVGIDSIDGFWYLSEENQKGYFNLGSIKTTDYTNVVATVSGRLVGSQEIKITINDNDLDGVPQHTHYLLHSEAPNLQGFPSGSNVDSYLSGYRDRTGKVLAFSPSGGVKLTHSHAITKRRLSGSNIATYDLFNWSGGDTGPGSINPNGNYWASGAAGRFEDRVYTPLTTFKIFEAASIIGGRDVNTDGEAFYEENVQEYTSVGNYTYSLPSNLDVIALEVIGGGGSGGVWKTAGNDGSDSVVALGDGSGVTIRSGGGRKGNSAIENTSTTPYTESAGTGGLGGTLTISGTQSANVEIISESSGDDLGIAGKPGSSGKFWNAQYTSSNSNWEGFSGGAGYGAGSNGKFLSVSSSALGTIVDTTYPNTASFGIVSSDPVKWKILSATIELYGAAGRNCGNYGGLYGCTTGVGGPGKYLKLSRKANQITGIIEGDFSFYPGQSGRPYNESAQTSSGSVGAGGRGGDGSGPNDGGGGGAVSTVYVAESSTIVAGAGGGGGGGGAGEGQCGDNSTGNGINDGAQAVTQNLFTGDGGYGGAFGCTGGGGGGGGGGCGLASQTGSAQGGAEKAGGNGGPGGGGGGNGGHGGGYGGGRGLSSYRSDYFDLVASGNSTTTEGKIYASITENRSYWTSAAGGGGSGAKVELEIPSEVINALNPSSLTITIGAGGTGVSSSLSRTINSSINWTESATTVTSTNATNGYVKITAKTIIGTFGGTTTTTVGDIIASASDGIQLYSTGSGSGTAGGFRLPTSQIPVVEIIAQGDQPGSGATATATVSGGIVTGLTLTSGGSGYTSAPKVRFSHGSGGGTQATTTINSSGQVDSITLVAGSSDSYVKYVKFGGDELERFIVINALDCTDVERFGVKAARGNGKNGGERPDDSGDQLLLFYNTDGSLNFPDNQFVDFLVPIPNATEISNDYDGDGTGTDATNWYTYMANLPDGAKTTGVRFKIIQKRVTPSGENDNGGNNDHYGICEFLYEYAFISELAFTSTPGEILSDAKTLSYVVEGSSRALYSAGIEVNDMLFTMSAGVPLTPVPALDPVRNIPLLEPYALTKYLIKAY